MPDSTHNDAGHTGAGHTECPACHGRLYPKVLHCADCGLDVTTRYAGNEFADLDVEDLHLLRIFVVCEGRIRDMESALGVSYPTVKSRLAALRGRLGLGADATKGDATATKAENASAKSDAAAANDSQSSRDDADVAALKSAASSDSTAAGSQRAASEPKTAREILDQLAAGATTYDEALSKIRALRGRS